MIITRNLPGFREPVQIELTSAEVHDAWHEYERQCTIPILWDMIMDRAPSLSEAEIDTLAERAWGAYNQNIRAGCSEEWSAEDAVAITVSPYLDEKLKQRDNASEK